MKIIAITMAVITAAFLVGFTAAEAIYHRPDEPSNAQQEAEYLAVNGRICKIAEPVVFHFEPEEESVTVVVSCPPGILDRYRPMVVELAESVE